MAAVLAMGTMPVATGVSFAATVGETPPAEVVAAGEAHSCAVRADGTLVCWGDNWPDEHASVPTGTFTQVSTGTTHSCAVRTDGTLACWGSDSLGQGSAVAGTFVQVDSGFVHNCGVQTDGTLACWGGDNDFGEASPPGGTFAHVAAGDRYSCGVQTDGTLACWGSDTGGKATPPAGTFTQVSTGSGHACALAADETVSCWGSNFGGAATPPPGTFSQVAAGSGFSCGVRTTGALACWGDNFSGRATPPAGTFSQVATGVAHACAAQGDGVVVCWGHDEWQQSSPPAASYAAMTANSDVNAPGQSQYSCGLRTDGTIDCTGRQDGGAPLAPSGTFTDVSSGAGHACAVRDDATATCWGNDDFGQANAPPGTFSTVSAGGAHTCGVHTDATVECWGDDVFGQASAPPGTFTDVSAGSNHSCGVRTDGTIGCWGSNGSGKSTPPPGTFTDVEAGETHTCGIASDATVTCWGSSTTAPAGTFVDLAVGYGYACGVQVGGAAECWGDDSYGQSDVPPGTFAQVSAGIEHSCGVRTDGVFNCWGAVEAVGDPVVVATDGPTLPPWTKPNVSIGDASVVEGDGGKVRHLKFSVTLTENSTTEVTVDYDIVSFDATGAKKPGPGVDYRNPDVTKTMRFPVRNNGTTAVRRVVSVPVYPDTDVEGDETLTVVLSNPTGGVNPGRMVATGTIIDDDATAGLEFAIGDASVVEGDLDKRVSQLSLTLSEPATEELFVDFVVTGGTATCAKAFYGSVPEGADCNDAGGKVRTIRFRPALSTGFTTVFKAIGVQTYPDAYVEGDETVTVTISNARTLGGDPVAISRSVGTITIFDDD